MKIRSRNHEIKMNDQAAQQYQCAYCGEWIETIVDCSAGSRQSYIEDCTVCCRPNLLQISIDPNGTILVSAEYDE